MHRRSPADRDSVETLFHQALERPETERAAFLAEACSDDAVRAEVEALLAVDRASTQTSLRSPWAESSPPSEVPERIGPYYGLRWLGAGGMGQVLLAEQREPVRRTVAIKLVREDRSSDAVLARFDAERQALAMMRHDAIAKILDAGTTEGGRAYFVMEPVEGAPITTFCAEHGLSLEARLGLFVAVCRGVQHAHQNGILHRDLKASNILVESQDGAPTPKIIDFGIAKILDAGETDQTQEGFVLGTPETMSPEQAAPSGRPIDARSDVWALGVLLYQLMTEVLPFEGDTVGGVLHRIRTADPVRPSERGHPAWTWAEARRVRVDLDWIVAKALEKEPDDRYASASELAADVERCLRHEPLVAGPPTTRYRIRKFVRKNRLAVGAAASLAFALVAGAAVSAWQASVARSQAERAERNLALADERLADYRRLVDVRRLAELRRAVDAPIGPVAPESLPSFESWLRALDLFAARMPDHRARIETLDQWLADEEADDETRESWAWQREVLAGLIADHEAMSSETRDSARSVVRRMVRLSEETGERLAAIDSLEEFWDEAWLSISDVDECPAYDGLELEPQRGLVPLGRNAGSGLWEFWHVASGAEPQWDEDGVRMTAEAGMVLVLLPGGEPRIGSVPSGPDGGSGPHVDPRGDSWESPVHDVELAPFFLSKFEVTQAQWTRLHDHNPSLYDERRNDGRIILQDTNPVETVSWVDCDLAFRRVGLVLPTEVQWEYACRAGTSTIFFAGDEDADLYDHGSNLGDEASKDYFAGGWYHDVGHDDGFTLHAPVGSFPPNAFGLHDMHGNVHEWCQDIFGDYTWPTRDGDGLRLIAESGRERRVYRGGAFSSIARVARSSARYGQGAGTRLAKFGGRAARPLDTP